MGSLRTVYLKGAQGSIVIKQNSVNVVVSDLSEPRCNNTVAIVLDLIKSRPTGKVRYLGTLDEGEIIIRLSEGDKSKASSFGFEKEGIFRDYLTVQSFSVTNYLWARTQLKQLVDPIPDSNDIVILDLFDSEYESVSQIKELVPLLYEHSMLGLCTIIVSITSKLDSEDPVEALKDSEVNIIDLRRTTTPAQEYVKNTVTGGRSFNPEIHINTDGYKLNVDYGSGMGAGNSFGSVKDAVPGKVLETDSSLSYWLESLMVSKKILEMRQDAYNHAKKVLEKEGSRAGNTAIYALSAYLAQELPGLDIGWGSSTGGILSGNFQLSIYLNHVGGFGFGDLHDKSLLQLKETMSQVPWGELLLVCQKFTDIMGVQIVISNEVKTNIQE